jgi:hypothetical protein
MFNLLKGNKGKENSDALTEATLNQKRSIINFLFVVHLYNDDNKSSNEGEEFINHCMNTLSVNKPTCLNKINKDGGFGMMRDLKNLNSGQKANLTMIVIGLMLTDANLKEDKINFVQNYIETLGLDGEKFLEIFLHMKFLKVTTELRNSAISKKN